MTRSLSSRPAVAGVGLITLVLLTACGTTAQPAEKTEAPVVSPSAPSAEPVETGEPEARLVVAYEDAVEVLDAGDLSEIASFPVDSAPYVEVAADGRHVITLEHQEKRVRIVDAGTWTEAHGDHGHSYTVSPARLDDVIEGTAYHALSDGTQTVIWNDDTGNIEVIDAADLEDGSITPRIIERNDVHHGVAVPLSDGYLASFSVDGDAAGVARLDDDGTEVERYEGCAGLHGEAHVGKDAYAFGCQDGILVVDETGARTVASPVEGAGTSTLIGDGSSPIIAGNVRSSGEDGPDLSTTVALYDTAAGTARAVDLGVEFSNMAVTEGDLVVVGVDGNLHVLDLASGEVRTIPATEPWEKPEEFLTPRPMLAVSHDHVWLTEPMTGKILVIDLTTGETLVSADVDGKPGRLAVVNFAGDEHDHS